MLQTSIPMYPRICVQPKYINELAFFDGEPLMLGFMVLPDAKFLMAVARFEEADGKIARIRSYSFNPEVLKEIAGILGLVEVRCLTDFPWWQVIPDREAG